MGRQFSYTNDEARIDFILKTIAYYAVGKTKENEFKQILKKELEKGINFDFKEIIEYLIENCVKTNIYNPRALKIRYQIVDDKKRLEIELLNKKIMLCVSYAKKYKELKNEN